MTECIMKDFDDEFALPVGCNAQNTSKCNFEMASVQLQYNFLDYYCMKHLDVEWKDLGVRALRVLVSCWDVLKKVEEGVCAVIYIV